MDDILSDFLTESAENLEAVNAQLVRFEAAPRQLDVLESVFRLVHTMKAGCGFLGLPRLEAVTHAAESALSRIRDGSLPVEPRTITPVLNAIDRIGELLSHIELLGVEAEGDDRDLIAALGALQAAPPAQPRRTTETVVPTPAARAKETPAPAFSAPVAPLPPIVEARPEAPPPAVPVPRPTVRVSLEVLDELMTRVGELVLTRNQLLQVVRGLEDTRFKAPLQRLSVITGELQEAVLRTRLEPVGTAWRSLPRLVRDLAMDGGKRIELITEGQTTTVERHVLEQLKDPLIHMVRNSADHGLEPPAKRLRLGKPETGVIRLSAANEGGFTVIRLSDDGGGLDTPRIRDRALERGLLSAEQAAALSDAQLHRFIFFPGFSTAPAITQVSGRGVGMDVVRSHIETLGGRIDLKSAPGEGVSFTIRIPRTLAIASAVVVALGERRFAIPELSVTDILHGPTVGPEPDPVSGWPLVRHEGNGVPLLSLAEDAPPRPETVLLVHSDGRRFALAVDAAFEPEEIIVKPLDRTPPGVAPCSGATLLGDGSAALVPDLSALAALLETAAPELPMATAEVDSRSGVVDAPPASPRVLLVDDNEMFRAVAVPLLAAAGYDVTAVETAEQAGALGPCFDAVVCDVDRVPSGAPVLPPGSDTPWIALTSLPLVQALKLAGGSAAVIRKSDREGLIRALAETLRSQARRAA